MQRNADNKVSHSSGIEVYYENQTATFRHLVLVAGLTYDLKINTYKTDCVKNKIDIQPTAQMALNKVFDSPWAKTINVFRACLGAQLTICAQK